MGYYAGLGMGMVVWKREVLKVWITYLMCYGGWRGLEVRGGEMGAVDGWRRRWGNRSISQELQGGGHRGRSGKELWYKKITVE